jgi:hypothetical protein
MSLNQDDLQRLRDGISRGWDFTHCHEIDFQAAVTELLDDALEGGVSLAQKVYDCWPGLSELDSAVEDLDTQVEYLDSIEVPLHEPEFTAVCNALRKVQETITEFRDRLNAADQEASNLL